MDEILACPFCGKKAVLKYNSGSEVYSQSWGVECTNCTAKTGRYSGSNSWAKRNADTKREDEIAKGAALTAWNTRTPL